MTADPTIVARTQRFVVVDKPSGLLSVPGKGPDKADCVASRVAQRFPDATGPLIVHRLDMETSGLMVLGLDKDAQRNLSIQFERRTVHKRYAALVEGWIGAPGDRGTIDLPLRADLDNRPIQIADETHGKPARTRWTIVAHETLEETKATRLELTPITGRTHQLRVHAALALNAPVLGDTLYGNPDNAPRLMLHATDLAFDDPRTGRRVACHSPTPFRL